MTRVVGLVPSKLNSKRLPQKNVRALGGVPLINYALRTLTALTEIDEVVVYASDDQVMAAVAEPAACSFVRRPIELDRDDATVQDFINGFLHDVECDVVVLLHATSPFMSVDTVRDCTHAVISGEFESAFAAQEIRRFAWFRGVPLNYSLDSPTPRTQDLEPVLVEQSGLYVFTRTLFERTGRRIAERPFVKVVSEIEGHDIDTAEELALAELLVSALGNKLRTQGRV